MNNVLAPYLDISPGTADEVENIIDQLESVIQSNLTAQQKQLLRLNHEGFQRHKRVVTLNAVSIVTGYAPESIAEIRGGGRTVPDALIRILRLVRDRVTDRPELASAAVNDWLERSNVKST